MVQLPCACWCLQGGCISCRSCGRVFASRQPGRSVSHAGRHAFQDATGEPSPLFTCLGSCPPTTAVPLGYVLLSWEPTDTAALVGSTSPCLHCTAYSRAAARSLGSAAIVLRLSHNQRLVARLPPSPLVNPSCPVHLHCLGAGAARRDHRKGGAVLDPDRGLPLRRLARPLPLPHLPQVQQVRAGLLGQRHLLAYLLSVLAAVPEQHASAHARLLPKGLPRAPSLSPSCPPSPSSAGPPSCGARRWPRSRRARPASCAWAATRPPWPTRCCRWAPGCNCSAGWWRWLGVAGVLYLRACASLCAKASADRYAGGEPAYD